MSASALPAGTRISKVGHKCNISLVLFSQVVQKQTMDAVENWAVNRLPVVSKTMMSKIIKI